ncbi:MAG TPA: CsbD family protein [Longimicrobium sp.]|nr:CsbD family protein [Longimicrobium sp.]
MADDMMGKVTHLGGKIKEGLGELLGDRSIEREGRLDQMEGAAEQDAARAEDAMMDANARRLEAQRAKELNRDLDGRGGGLDGRPGGI